MDSLTNNQHMVNTAPRAAGSLRDFSVVPLWMTLCIGTCRIFPPLPTVPEKQAFAQHGEHLRARDHIQRAPSSLTPPIWRPCNHGLNEGLRYWGTVCLPSRNPPAPCTS